MIKNVKKKERVRHLPDSVCRHRWSWEGLVKRWKMNLSTTDESHSVGWKLLIFHLFTRPSLLQRCLQMWVGWVLHSFLLFNIFYHLSCSFTSSDMKEISTIHDNNAMKGLSYTVLDSLELWNMQCNYFIIILLEMEEVYFKLKIIMKVKVKLCLN